MEVQREKERNHGLQREAQLAAESATLKSSMALQEVKLQLQMKDERIKQLQTLLDGFQTSLIFIFFSFFLFEQRKEKDQKK